jgi:hypothetical protein
MKTHTERAVGIRTCHHSNERVKLEMQITKCRQLISRTTDDEFIRRAQEKSHSLSRSAPISMSKLGLPRHNAT